MMTEINYVDVEYTVCALTLEERIKVYTVSLKVDPTRKLSIRA